jgi:hypothetical protein
MSELEIVRCGFSIVSPTSVIFLRFYGLDFDREMRRARLQGVNPESKEG